MGMDKYTHIGPYLMIPRVKKDVVRTIRVDKSGQEVNTGYNFDPVTGEEYATKHIIENVINEPRTYGDDEHYPEFEGLGLDEDEFWEPDGSGTKTHTIFIPNESNFQDDDLISLKGLDVGDELSKFISKYVKYIQYYEKVYGPIIVDYGVVQYWS